DKKKIPQKVWDNLNYYGKGYEIIFFSDDDCVNYLKRNFSIKFSNKFKNLKHGAHKADLFRYCVLYKEGGIYLDIDLEPKVKFDQIFDHNSEKLFYTVITGSEILNNVTSKKKNKIKKWVRRLKNKSELEIFQALIATYPNNPIFKKLIKDFWVMINPHKNHNITTIKFYYRLQDLIKKKLNEGIFFTKNEIKIILFSEKNKKNKNENEKPDKLGRYCKIYDGEKRLFNSRYVDYPW
ncbi:glycosyltransferase, partial [Candidatus Pelagibacter sp.]|nr:glycosyltransferase [Candidatus Pelagibacter sp.]